MKYIPNFINCLNLTSGFIAVVFASNGDLVTASWLILAAMVFDFLDGFSAKLLKAYSEMGKELDSLADIVSFGVAPAVILIKLIHSSLYSPDPFHSSAPIMAILTYIPALMPVCAGLRLAKFNIDPAQTTSFRGLPTPANAIGVISIVVAAHFSGMSLLKSFIAAPSLLIIYTIILSLLMVTRIPLLSLKISSAAFKGNEGRYILAGLVLVSFLIFGIGAAPLIIPFYLLSSFFSALFWPAVSAG
jgi:CDP-diacylglycerol--serine O-phosphatidyltransferase